MKYANMILLFLITSSLLAMDADTEDFIDRLDNVSMLRMDRIELDVSASVTLVGISAVTADKLGNIYVLHRPETGDPVVMLDPAGNFLRSWGEGMFKIPHGIRVDQEGNVWTVDSTTSVVYKFSSKGALLLRIDVGDIPDPSDPFCGAADLAFTDDRHVLVADGYCNGRVLEYDEGGQKVREWGSTGDGPGEFKVLHSIATGPRGNIYVADRENGRLQWFDRHGEFLGQWKYASQLYSVAFNPDGELFVSVAIREDAAGEPQSNVIRVDPATGEMLERIEVFAHELAFAPDGTLLPATRSNELLLFRTRE